ncbi:MAG: M36 family metallopeptidase [Chitinophagaceae bacterium]|nr:M36 family metallopeptidase [Chitinophagaceae bacterium]
MKKFLFLLLITFYFNAIHAQLSQVDAAYAKQLVAKNSALIGLSADDQQNILVSSTYKTMDGLQMVYLQQSHLGIPVYNQLQVLAFQNGRIVSNAGGRIPDIQKSTRGNNGMPSVSAVTAVKTALLDVKATALEAAVPIYTSADGHKFEFGKLGATNENIKADLLWYPKEGKNEVRLVWQVFVTPKNSSDYWLIRVDANTNTVIDKTNLTITCNWDKKGHSVEAHIKENHSQSSDNNYVIEKPAKKWKIRPDVISSASYRVIKYPAESPLHVGGTPAIHIDPWTMAGPPASSLGWHNDGTTLHDSTRGNNVWAQEDRDNNNSTFGNAALSTTNQPTLTLDYTFDLTTFPANPATDNQKAAITNLFYWNNLIHDIAYVYGFDEPSGNFQNNNQGRGGLGVDYVIADAQDAGGTNNANFSTGADGSRPRMQMFIWTAANPDRDGDLDNGIVVHEYTHGISNRYTGGPSSASCLGNDEQGGEGWSDYFALMSTTNWATATVNDGVIRRGIGTYASNQNPTGVGIRSAPYSTDMSIYPRTYANLPATGGQQHAVGEIWCMMLWEMTWEIIKQDNAINPNLFAPGSLATMIGNSSALKLVSEGLRLQPCNPGFVDARDAILRADTILFNRKYSCSIWKAFAKRGLGRYALQGSASSAADGIADFTPDAPAFRLTTSAAQVQEGQNVTYTTTVTTTNCGPLNNSFITDTLPTNVTYVSGGSYNTANRTVTFIPVSLPANSSQNFSFTVTVNNGSYFAPLTHLNETVASAGIPASWTATSIIPATAWTTSTVFSNSTPNSFFAANPTVASDFQLATTNTISLLPNSASNYTTLSFWHRFNTEDGWDGGMVEISTNGGTTWNDLGSKMISGKYNGSMGTGSNNPIGGRAAFTGSITSFMKTVINLSSYAGQAIKIRFRFASDDNTAPTGGGWFVDDIVIYTEPAVYIKSNLFNGSSVLLSTSDTLTRILQTMTCVPVSVTTQPANTNSCTGGNASISVLAAGTAPVYQWQVNTGSGFVNVPAAAPYSGTTTNTLTISGITAGMAGYQYRCVLSNACTTPFNSGTATLSVGATATLNSQPSAVSTCTGTTTTLNVTATNAGSFQWQVNTGTGFVNITNTAPHSGATTATLTITGVTAAMNNNQYRSIIGSCPTAITSNAATLTVVSPVAITTQPTAAAVCQNTTATFSVVATGTITGYQWQVSTDGGTNFININGATTATLTLNNVTLTQNTNRYRVVITGNCNTLNSNNALLTVNAIPSFTIGNVPSPVCISDPAVNLTASLAGGTWSGNGVQGSQFLPSVAGLVAFVLTYTVTNSFGCTLAQSKTIQVNACPERQLTLNLPNSIIVYPNPGNGRLSLLIKTALYKKIGIRLYASDGKLLKTQQLTGITYNSIVPVDLTRFSNGVYQLYLYNDENGVFIDRTIGIVISR